jgi:hypothetical protein
MLEDKGNTAVYLLYANTRIRSLKIHCVSHFLAIKLNYFTSVNMQVDSSPCQCELGAAEGGGPDHAHRREP